MNSAKGVRNKNLDVLRGLSAMAVVAYHFIREDSAFPAIIKGFSSFGYLGVEVFFVISGFVIPLSLQRSKYNISKIGHFLLRRFLRLYPAYFCASILSLLLWYVSTMVPGFRGHVPELSVSYIVTNLFLLADFFESSWILVVAWTLAIEAQYYLLIGLTFPLLVHKRLAVRLSVLCCWIVAPYVAGVGPTVFTWTALFSVGLLLFSHREKLLSPGLVGIFMSAALTTQLVVKGMGSMLAGCLAVAFILFMPSIASRPLLGLGLISYSLYLCHVFTGGRVINFFSRFGGSVWIEFIAVFTALAVSVIFSLFFFRLIEKPSHELARR